MKTRILKIVILVAVLQVSCKKALEVDPTSTITSESFWKMENDVKGGIDGMYVRLRQEASRNLFLFGEARSDMMTNANAGTLNLDRYYLNSLNSSTPGIANSDWSGLYTTINAANLLLKYIPRITFADGKSKNNYLAQAYTMRAYAYFVLTKTWGDLPVRLEPTESYDPESIQIARSPKAEVFKLIKEDIETALSLYADNTYPSGRNAWSKPAATALKAEVYLWTAKLMNGGTADLNTALAAINAVQTSDTQLLPNFSDVFTYANKGNKEIIMAVRFQLLESEQNLNYRDMFFHTSNFSANPNAAARIVLGAVAPGQNVWRIAPAIQNQFSNDDKRKAATWYDVYRTTGAFYATIGVKFKGIEDAGTRHFKDDVILFRYADILLMKAEIKNALNQDPAPEINEVRQRAYGTNASKYIFISGGKQQNDDAILKERLFEFAIEGKRWWDLLRFGKAFDLVPSLQNKKGQDYLLLFPIGNEILSLEPKVRENPGWQ
ncbi:MAG: RagB/SusD family nutrient uptake outer membrane protein [Daejeonella sp.]